MIAWQATVQDDEGNVIVNPSITVRRASDGSLADIFDAAGNHLANPFTGSSEGFCQFFAQPGEYTIQGARGGSVTQTWIVTLVGLELPATLTSLSALNASTNQMPYFSGPGVMALTGLTPAARAINALAGASGAKIPVVTGTGTAALRDIVGTVSQSGGVPTGAIIQRGSNANGAFVRFADGTQICWLAPRTITLSDALGTLWRGVAPGLPYPASFVGTPTVVPTRAAGGITSEMVSSWPGNPTNISTTQCDLRWIGATHNANVAGCAATATGRWF